MRKTPRSATLVLFLVVVVLAIWRLSTCDGSPTFLSAPAPSATPSAASTSPAPPARSQKRALAPLPLLSADVAADATAALGAFEGKVISSGTGKGIEGAVVVLEHGGSTVDVKTGAGGAFTFAPPEPGAYVLVFAAADGHRPFAPAWDLSPVTWIARPGTRVSGFVLALDPERIFDVQVVSPQGDPVAGADVRVLRSARRSAAHDTPETPAKIVTGADGTARAALPSGALIEARHPAFGPGRTRVTLAAEASKAITIRLRSKGDHTFGDASLTISGRVLDPSGQPIAGARAIATRIEANHAAVNADLHPSGMDLSDADGTFEIDGLDEGAYEVTATDGEHATATARDIAAGTTNVTLRLGASGAITGLVRSASGAKVPAFSIVVSLVRGPLEREAFASRSFLDAEGRYEIEGLGPGTYEVVAAALGSAPSKASKATISDPPGAPVVVDLTLERGATLRGTVLSGATSATLEGARVELEGALAASEDVPLVASAVTSADGSFVLAGLARGSRSLSVTAAGHHGRIVSGIVVGDADPEPIRVTLTKVKPGEEPGIELVGIGAVLTPKGDALLVGQVISGGGAAEVGLAPGDEILAIDGAAVVDLGFEGSIGKIRGPEDSTVVLTVRKAGATGAIDIPVPRRRIKG